VEELGNSNCRSKDAKREAHSVIFVDDDEEESVSENGPDEDISKDTRNQMMRVGDHQSTIPVDCNKGPGQGCRHNRRMNKSRVRVVAEVKRGEVDEVEHQDNLGPVKVRADKEHDKCEMEEVVEDEVASNAGGSVNDVGVAREEVANVTSLENEQDNPVDGSDDWVQSESSAVHVVLLPDLSVSRVAIIIGTVEGVINSDNKGQDPGNEGEDLVGKDCTVGVGVPLHEGIVLLPVRHDELLYDPRSNRSCCSIKLPGTRCAVVIKVIKVEV
jgi:hypothetical protein